MQLRVFRLSGRKRCGHVRANKDRVDESAAFAHEQRQIVVLCMVSEADDKWYEWQNAPTVWVRMVCAHERENQCSRAPTAVVLVNPRLHTNVT